MPKSRTTEEIIQDNLIVKHLAGSRAYGTNHPNSDIDRRGIFCADPINILTPWYPMKEAVKDDEDDTKLLELRHFMKLAMNCNPNVIETLWVDESDIIDFNEIYYLLRDAREHLLTKQAAESFTGYANEQLRRMRGHNKWINKPQPKEMPQQVDFVSLVQWFGESKVLPRDFSLRKYHEDFRLVPYGKHIFGLYGYVRKIDKSTFTTKGYRTFDPHNGSLFKKFDGERHSMVPPAAILKFNFVEYRRAKIRHRQYWRWVKERNPKRAVLEEKYGYDTKNALHLVRLMRMGVEIMETGQVLVKRPDAADLLDVLNGKWKYEEVLEYAKDMDEKIKTLVKKSDLRDEPDYDFAADLLQEAQEFMWGYSGD